MFSMLEETLIYLELQKFSITFIKYWDFHFYVCDRLGGFLCAVAAGAAGPLRVASRLSTARQRSAVLCFSAARTWSVVPNWRHGDFGVGLFPDTLTLPRIWPSVLSPHCPISPTATPGQLGTRGVTHRLLFSRTSWLF